MTSRQATPGDDELGVEDVRSVAVAGDTTNDLYAGHRAGAGIVAGILGGAHPREELERAPHTHIFETVGQFAELVSTGRPATLETAGRPAGD